MQRYVDGHKQHVTNSEAQGFKPMRLLAYVKLAIQLDIENNYH
jgi:hypothetical protein